MKNLKKLPTKQLEKFSNIFTQLGLVLVLFIVYLTLEHQTEQKTAIVFEHEKNKVVYFDLDTEVLFTKEPKKVKPKPIVIKCFFGEEIEKVDNEVPEVFISHTSIKDPVLVDIDNVIVERIPESIEETVPFINIEDAPVFKGCEGLSKKENKICFDKKMKQFVQRNFDAELANELGLHSGKHRISTQFLINDKGFIVDVKIRAPHKKLEKETQRLIDKLPQFTPGKQRNRPVKVRYTLPITFSVE